MKKQTYSTMHPFQMLARSSRENLARMETSLKMTALNDMENLLCYVPTKTLTFEDKGVLNSILIKVAGFNHEGEWKNSIGLASLKSIRVDGQCVILEAHPNGTECDTVKDIPADAQDFRTLDRLHKAVCDYIAEKFDVDRIKD